MLGIDGEICKVQLMSGPTDFRTTVIKLYLQPELTEEPAKELTKEPTEEPTKEPIEELTEKPAEEPAEEPAADAPRQRSKRT